VLLDHRSICSFFIFVCFNDPSIANIDIWKRKSSCDFIFALYSAINFRTSHPVSIEHATVPHDISFISLRSLSRCRACVCITYAQCPFQQSYRRIRGETRKEKHEWLLLYQRLLSYQVLTDIAMMQRSHLRSTIHFSNRYRIESLIYNIKI